MILLVNQDLKDASGKATKMSAGKVAAQCGHATLGAYKRGLQRSPGAVKAWEYIGQAKIAVKCPSTDEMMATRDEAARRGVSFYLVCDAGHTQIAPGSQTVLAVGPAPVAVLDEFTRKFKLY
jgi:peptidyl-tRNA hydrolase